MKCPECGEEIDTVEMVESNIGSEVSVWKENEDGTFDYLDVVDSNVYESQVEDVQCPECEASLKWRFEKGKLVIESGV